MKRSLQKLISVARKAHRSASLAAADAMAPYGFATRVAARWAEGRQPRKGDAWQRLCWWGATVSVAVCLASAIYRTTAPEPSAYDLLLAEPGMDADVF